MTPDRWERIGRVFEHALHLPVAERERFVADACTDDPALAREVAAMLRAHAGPGILDREITIDSAFLERDHLSPELEPGAWVGPYQVRGEIDRGGMGVVYEAHDPRLDRLVALKCLPGRHRKNPIAKAQFLAEARAAAALDHPNICTVFDIGEVGEGGLFIAMARYDGRTLRELLTDGPLDPPEAMRIARGIALGLARAHEAGIVHRDIKPSNVIITARGEPKILDFGIAQLGGDQDRTGLPLGTPHYMSPQQIRREAVDHRSDLWSLGVVLYEMLAGCRPFEGDGPREVLQRIVDGAYERLASRRPQLPDGLVRIVDRLLAPVLRDRFQHAEEVATALAAGTAHAEPAGPHRASSARVPAFLTSFVGRGREVDAVARLLGRARLVTLTGPGGTGKTRLAFEVARRVQAEYAGGVSVVHLAALADPALVPAAIAEALGVPPDSSRSVGAAVAEWIGSAHMLLVLDNFEQVIAGAAAVPPLLESCRSLRVLATSRVALRVEGEHQVAVAPLAVPAAAARADAKAISASPAVELFVERARAVIPGFSLTAEDAPAVAELCAHLDGLPLAIELAAANLRLMPVRTMLARLASRFDVLRRGGPDRPLRHRSLRAAIAWSYDLLEPFEQRVFRNLSVCVGGCTLESAESLCASITGATPDPILDALATLLEHNLVRREEAAAEPRFVMLESLRAFAAEALTAAGEQPAAAEAHAAHFLALVEQAEPAMVGPDQAGWLDRLQFEHDNLRAAVGWALASRRADLALRFGAALWRFWLSRGHLEEGCSRLQSILDQAGPPDSALHVRALNGLATLLQSQGRGREARNVLERALEACARLRDPRLTATIMNNLAWVALELTELQTAEAVCPEALAANRAVGDTRGVALALNNLGWLAQYRGDHRRSRALHAESLEVREAVGDERGVAFALSNLAVADGYLGDFDRAADDSARSLAILERVRDPLLLGWALVTKATWQLRLGRYADALDTLALSRETWREGGNRSVAAAGWRMMGECHLGLGDTTAADHAFQQALAHYRGIDSPWGTGLSLHGQARVTFAIGNRRRAEELLDESLAIAERIGNRLGIAECHETLALFSEAHGDHDAAARSRARAAAIREELGVPRPAGDL